MRNRTALLLALALALVMLAVGPVPVFSGAATIAIVSNVGRALDRAADRAAARRWNASPWRAPMA